MKHLKTAIALAAMVSGTAVYAQDDFSAQLKARQGQFRIMAINLGILGSMAKGETEYSAEAAQAAADTLVAVSMIQQGPMWPEGSNDMAIDGTRAQTTIWEQNDDFLSKWSDFGTAAQAVQASAGNGQEALGPLLGQIGGTCKACHDTHRAPAN
ncbi:c-type cytochrome [Marivita hallyeonensis]|uniref:Cytochrome c556 n=1 Tax=Marivita hallyeonensis TaxID=996342 RepID=A0A1M5R5J4_9RHOB|nr:cytochrome c [Marivita hallyeonensis]SHH21612.1 Cytochrome c556 [Marivita hallyeonensis]